MTRSPAFSRVLQEIGAAVVHGELPVGSTVSVQALTVRTRASRSIVREAVRVLAALGLLTASPRVGLRVRPAQDWNLLDPLVLGWRAAGPDRALALDELRDLRAALEPAAARAAAQRVGDAEPADLAGLHAAAAGFTDPDVLADPRRRSALDAGLHASVLALSGNALFVRLQGVVERALREREHVPPVAHDMALHADLARAVLAGDGPGAEALMREIVDRT